MSSDADGTRKKASKHHKKVGWPPKCIDCPEPAPYCCPAAEMMLSRPRSSTPTIHDQMMMIDRHRVRAAESAGRAGGHLAAGRASPYRQTTVKRQHEGRGSQRSQSSELHRRHSKAKNILLSLAVFVSLKLTQSLLENIQ